MSLKALNIGKFRESFLEGIDNEFNHLEQLFDDVKHWTEKESKEGLYNLFREIHHLKARTDSYELFMISSILNQVEDLVGDQDPKMIDSDFCLKGMKFIELAKSCGQDYLSGSSEIDKYVTVLESFNTLDLPDLENRGKVLVVETTGSIKKIFQKICEELNFDVVFLTNGVSALNRLIHERFDAVFSSGNLEGIDGESLFKAIRVMKGANNRTPLVLMSSNEKNIDSLFKVDFFLKDNSFLENVRYYLSNKVTKNNNDKDDQYFKFKKVLFAEDDLMIQKIIEKVFAAVPKSNLSISSNLDDSLNQISKAKPDLIILDYFLDGCVGPDIIKAYFDNHGYIETPILFMTSTPDKVDLNNLSKYGLVKGVIEKPIKASHLLDEINLLT